MLIAIFAAAMLIIATGAYQIGKAKGFSEGRQSQTFEKWQNQI